MADKLNRPIEHLQQFVAEELGTECSLSQKESHDNQQGHFKLVIKRKGGIKKSGILKILYAYIDTYVQCNVCGDLDTDLTKEQRQFFVTCKKCLSKECC